MEYSKTFCPYPWIHVMTQPTGTVSWCCVARDNFKLGRSRVVLFIISEPILDQERMSLPGLMVWLSSWGSIAWALTTQGNTCSVEEEGSSERFALLARVQGLVAADSSAVYAPSRRPPAIPFPHVVGPTLAPPSSRAPSTDASNPFSRR